jgi:hypothetical protein
MSLDDLKQDVAYAPSDGVTTNCGCGCCRRLSRRRPTATAPLMRDFSPARFSSARDGLPTP